MKARLAAVLTALVVALALAPSSRADFGYTTTATASGVTLGGDVTGAANANTVSKINGTTVPAGGALTTGNVLQVSGVGADTYAPVNLAGGAGYVTGVLPAANQAAQACGGDLSGTAGSCVVATIQGASPLNITPAVVEWVNSTTGATLGEASLSTQTQGNNLSIKPQQSTQATNNGGGSLIFPLQTPAGNGAEAQVAITRGGTNILQFQGLVGAATNGAIYPNNVTPSGGNELLWGDGSSQTIVNAGGGAVYLEVDAVQEGIFGTGSTQFKQPVGGVSGNNAFAWESTSQALTSGSNVNLANNVYDKPHIKITGTNNSSSTSFTFPSTLAACWDIDASAVTWTSGTISLKANSNTWGTTLSSSNLYAHVCYTDAGKLVGHLETP